MTAGWPPMLPQPNPPTAMLDLWCPNLIFPPNLRTIGVWKKIIKKRTSTAMSRSKSRIYFYWVGFTFIDGGYNMNHLVQLLVLFLRMSFKNHVPFTQAFRWDMANLTARYVLHKSNIVKAKMSEQATLFHTFHIFSWLPPTPTLDVTLLVWGQYETQQFDVWCQGTYGHLCINSAEKFHLLPGQLFADVDTEKHAEIDRNWLEQNDKHTRTHTHIIGTMPLER